MNDLIINFQIEGYVDLQYITTIVKNTLKELNELTDFNYKIKVNLNINM